MYLRAEARELLISQQAAGANDGDLDQRGGPAKVVEGLQRICLSRCLDQTEDLLVTYSVVAFAWLPDDVLDLAQDPLAEALPSATGIRVP